MNVEIVTPIGIRFSGEVTTIRAPGLLGDMGILPGHQPLLAALRTGECVVSQDGREPLHLVVDGGYVHVLAGGQVTITTEVCEGWQQIDAAAVQESLVAANAELAQTKDAVTTRIWQLRKHNVELAEARLRVAASKP